MRLTFSLAQLLCLVISAGGGVSQSSAPEPAKPLAHVAEGTISGHTYTNPTLGVSTDFPEGWQVVPARKQEELIEKNHQASFGDSPALKREHEMVWRCNRMLLWTLNEREGGVLTLNVWDAACFPEVTFPASKDDHEGIQRLIKAFRRPPVGEGKHILGPGEKVTTFVLQDHLLIDVTASMSDEGAAAHVSTVVTPIKNYWIMWMFRASSEAGLQKLKGATFASVKFAVP